MAPDERARQVWFCRYCRPGGIYGKPGLLCITERHTKAARGK